ncbi:hypothetical protein CSC2_30380 [Clostridium zeae]|uniref:Prepilin-type N-terminal cleavage/methylation domain-containing protein n=1 Tax=Clostridium zeae TaxID=2759022 RepID=A0ABQ1ECG8_9CLOT|nr:prepilin-type N-terminal cleavage/methylation domain-containing protein [Clostridium zeae]GFZ32512.1 hypothetical protein CSC2_30380 [Clostridium zeae]
MSIKSKKKKGMTLLEVIISIAIIGIMIVPIGNMILTSVKINKNGEDKQQAVYLSQQVLDGLKSIGSFENATIVLNNDSSNPLLINALGTAGSLNLGDYRVDVTINRKNQDVSYNNNDTSTSYDEKVEVSRDDDNRTFTLDGTVKTISNNKNDLYITVNSSVSGGVTQYNLTFNNTTTNNIFTITKNTFTNKINVKFSDLYESGSNFNIHVTNGLTSELKVYVTVPIDRVFREDNSRTIKYSSVNEGGLVSFYNASEGNADTFSKNYDAKVEIFKHNDLIYSVNSNIAK